MSLRHHLQEYLSIRRSLGYDLRANERILRRFVEFIEAENAPHVTTVLFLRWQDGFGHAGRQTWAARLSMVRLFAQWLHGFDPGHEVPPRNLIPSRNRRVRPHIYSDEQIAAIIEASAKLASTFRTYSKR